MRFNLQIELDNDAFYPCPDFELSRIFSKLMKEFGENKNLNQTKAVLDVNGNTVGKWWFSFSNEDKIS